MIKRKAAETQPKSSGRHEPKATKAQPKSNGRPELKAAKKQPGSNGVAERHATTDRPHKASMQHHERKLEKFRGALQEFNFSPKGGIEGFLLHSEGQTVQVNVTPDVGFAVVRGIGQNVEATVELDSDSVTHGKGDHPVYSLVTLTGTDGKALIHAAAGDAETATVHGVVKRINYDRHGAANGLVLESGDFVHLEPEGMKSIGLKVGDTVTAEGAAALMPLGQQVIEAKTVNGVAVMAKKPAQSGSRKAR
jgi:hypothetical protein